MLRETKRKRKTCEKKRWNAREQGITLVALVITVIIIIILATVTINMAFGDNGLITQAQKAKDMTANSIAAEQEGMNSVMSEYLNVIGEDSEITPPEPEIPDIPGGQEAVETGAIEFTNPTWASGQASVTISTNTSYALQYQVVANEGASSAKNWQEVPEGGVIGNLNHRDVVYARLVQGTNYGEEASTTVKDEQKPQKASINLSSASIETGASVTATVTHIDNESGPNITASKYIWNTSSTELGEDASRYTEGTFDSNGQEISKTMSAEGTYYLHVLTIDKAGNATETVSDAITVKTAGIPESESYVGYYADVDGNGSVDGIIYADLAFTKSGEWGNSFGTYSYTKKSNLKKYKVEGSYTANGLGSKGIVKPNGGSGNERFYVMALSDVDTSTHQFWGGSTSTVTSLDFGTGESNTAAMRSKSGSSSYLWGLSAVKNGRWNGSSGWYVPSRCELVAFGDAFDITKWNYDDYGLSRYYWSSSQDDTNTACYADFNDGYMHSGSNYGNYYVRLGTTF